MADAEHAPIGSTIRWEDPRFAPEIEKVRQACGVTHTDDDAMFGMCVASGAAARAHAQGGAQSGGVLCAGCSTGATGTTPK